MYCKDIHELAPLWQAGELDAARRSDFDSHVAGCEDCAAEMRQQLVEDKELRQVITSERADTQAIEHRVMSSITRERVRRWAFGATGVAAAAAAAFFVTAHSNAKAAPNPAIFADAARDHTVEIMQHQQRRWRTELTDISTIETSQGVSDADVKAIEATGYKLQRAKICRLGGTPYMHMVYAKNGHEFSVYMKVRGTQAVADAESSKGNLQLASFERGRVQAVIVSDAPRSECDKFAKAAKAAL